MAMSGRRPRRRVPALACVAGGALALTAAGLVVALINGGREVTGPLADTRHALACLLPVGLIVARAVTVRRDRLIWSVLATGALFYATALALWSIAFGAGTDTPSDTVFFTGDLLFWGGLGLYLRRRVGDALHTFWLDTVGAAIYLLALLSALWLSDVRAHSGVTSWTAISNLFYPAADAALATVPLVVASFSGRRMRGQDVLLAATFVVACVTDTAYVAGLAGHMPDWGGVLGAGWELQLLLLGCAAWARPSAAGALRVGGWWESLPTVLLMGIGGGLLIAASVTDLDPITVGLAAAALAAGVVRSSLMLRDVRALVVQRREALVDDLTGLPNRRALFRALDLLTRDGGGAGERAELLVIDVEGFRELNETLGHKAGDALLRGVAGRLAPVVGGDLLVRLGADEFAALLRPPADGAEVAERIRTALAEPIDLDGVTVAIEGTVGIARFPEDARETVELARRADVAMSEAKRRRAGVGVYAAERDEHSRERLELAADLRTALAARDCGGLWAAFQPQIHLADGSVGGAETLVRWTHPERGEISPAELLPVAERSGQMSVLTDWILDRALRECAGLANQGHVLRIGVNVSAVTLVDMGLPERIADALHRHRVPPEQLVIEVTEDAVMSDQRRCLDILERIGALGVGISIDDFGTGQSSLAQLRHLPADELKIDRSFVKGMADDPLDAEIVRLVVAMGRRMGLRVVAEGVETEGERAVLERLGCDVGQGYGLGRPMPATALEQFLEDAALRGPERRYAA